MNRIDYYRATLLGVILGMSFLTLFYIVFYPYSPEEVKEVQQQSKQRDSFTVVDNYRGCDVLQWHYGPLAEYKYFLYCNNTRPVFEK